MKTLNKQKSNPMVKQVTEVDPEFLSSIDNKMETILSLLKKEKLPTKAEFLTAQEFMDLIKVSRWKLDMLISQGLLDHKKIGRKIYVHVNQVDRFFKGEMQLDKK